MRPTINKIWFDRRAEAKPLWLCSVTGGVGPNATNIGCKGVGCSRWLAWRRAKREWKRKTL